ncbi:MAG: acetylornithine/succinylornithine family transaminase [Clostridia bacterium]|nr:acetylornithine/succinylornithine family transaminase [Clostridia bacterium]
MSIIETDHQYVANTYKRFPVALVRGKGAKAWDENGKEYIDLGSGIAVNIFGYGDEKWKQAVTAQLDALPHSSNLYHTEPCGKLAKMLCERTGMKKVFFANSGAEANECAVKAARKYAYDKYGDESHSTVITLKNSFHGRTLGMLSATGQDHFHRFFGPFTPGFVYAEANNLSDVKRLSEENGCCAVMVEMVQGEGGVMPLNYGFVKGIWQLCKEKDMLFIVDEVQTGNGRSGRLFSYMNFERQPDIVTTAKGLGGGLPIGACLLGEKAENTLGYGDHGSTFGGNPAVCAGAISILERIDDALLQGVRERSAFIVDKLNGAKGLKSISGMGLMLGLETERSAGEIAGACLARGVLVLTAKAKVRLLPPLTIGFEELEKAVSILREEIERV